MATSDEGSFDLVIIGTGLVESITAAALSKAGFKVAHLDQNPYYGSDEASLTVEEFTSWLKSKDGYSLHLRDKDSEIPQGRQYAITLLPSIIPSVGPLITSLVESGVSRYGGFKLLDRVAVFVEGKIKNVPGSKEDIFKDDEIRLLDKRRLMKFLMFCISDGELAEKEEVKGKEETPFVGFLSRSFGLNTEMANAVAYALAYCTSPSDPTLPALSRIQHYLRSAGRYGASPFLVGHYGSLGEIAQGFCRAAAVSGGVYILGRDITSISRSTDQTGRKYTIQMADFPEPLRADLIISLSGHVSSDLLDDSREVLPSPSTPSTSATKVARCTTLLDVPLTFPPAPSTSSTGDTDDDEEQPSAPEDSEVDTAILIFPPSSLETGSTEHAATVLINGEGTMSTPQGKSIIYITLPIQTDDNRTAEAVLTPYLEATLSATCPSTSSSISPLLSAFYFDNSPPPPSPTTPHAADEGDTSKTILIPPSIPRHPLPAPADLAAEHAESMFWESVKLLKARPHPTERSAEGEENAEEGEEIASFWPPAGSGEGNAGGEED